MPSHGHLPRPFHVSTHSVASIDVLSTRDFRKTFLGGLSREIERMTIVSPYVTPIPGFSSTHEFFSLFTSRMPDASFRFVTAPPNNRKQNALSWEQAKLIDQLGVSLMIRPHKLHSKVYYLRYPEGDSSSFVGSANFTKGGFKSNDETIAYWRSSGPDMSLEREIARLTGPGSYSLIQWTVKTTAGSRFEEADDAT